MIARKTLGLPSSIGRCDGPFAAGRDGDDAWAVRRVAEQLGYGVESVRSWVKQADIDDGARPGVSTSEAERVNQLEQENRELRARTRSFGELPLSSAELDRQQRR